MTPKSRTVEGLERGCFAVFNGGRVPGPLADLAVALLERQKKTWPGLASGYEALGEARLREIRGDGWVVKVQFNPRRIASSGARVDPETIRRRLCFLCPDHLPPEQQAILYRDEYLVLCNPMLSRPSDDCAPPPSSPVAPGEYANISEAGCRFWSPDDPLL
jgi:hypothetical protein